MDKLATTSRDFRKARTRQLIQLGALIEKAGLLETFEITLGADLQQELEMKLPVAGLFKGLVTLNELANSQDVYIPLWSQQGLQLLGELNRKNPNTDKS